MLRPRATGILGELLGQFNRDDSFVPSPSVPYPSRVPYNVDPTGSSARTFGKALDQFNMSQSPTPLSPPSLRSQREPFRPPVNLGDTSAVNPGVPANAPMGQRITSPQITPRIGDRDMGGAGVTRPGADVMGMEKLAEQAAKAVKIEQERPEIAAQPGFMKTVTDFFGDRENMLRLAAGFNAMTLRPDTGLASIISSELEDIRARKVSSKTVPAIISFLRSKGYEEYAKVVEQNPAMAKTVYEQVIQKELKPGATAKTSGVQYDAQGRAFVNVSKDGSQSIEFLKDAQGNQIMGETTQDKQSAELAAAKMQAQYASAQKYSDSVLKKADNLDQQLQLFDRAIEALGEGAQTGPIDQFLPSVRAASRELETIANELGITVINSATFGALSESELRLALDTNLPLGLNEGELKKFLRRKMAAVTKLKAEILNKAVDMRTMPYDEFLKKQRDEAQENVRFLTPPSDFQPIGGVQWDDMTLQEKKQYMELSQ